MAEMSSLFLCIRNKNSKNRFFDLQIKQHVNSIVKFSSTIIVFVKLKTRMQTFQVDLLVSHLSLNVPLMLSISKDT